MPEYSVGDKTFYLFAEKDSSIQRVYLYSAVQGQMNNEPVLLYSMSESFISWHRVTFAPRSDILKSCVQSCLRLFFPEDASKPLRRKVFDLSQEELRNVLTHAPIQGESKGPARNFAEEMKRIIQEGFIEEYQGILSKAHLSNEEQETTPRDERISPLTSFLVSKPL